MREIKFRAWDGKKMRGWGFIDNGFVTPPSESGGHNYPMMQYTGLKDKNGVGIFEGDILRGNKISTNEEIIKEVKWQEDGAAFYTDLVYGSWPAVMVGEVIGNIYENPDLLTP